VLSTGRRDICSAQADRSSAVVPGAVMPANVGDANAAEKADADDGVRIDRARRDDLGGLSADQSPRRRFPRAGGIASANSRSIALTTTAWRAPTGAKLPASRSTPGRDRVRSPRLGKVVSSKPPCRRQPRAGGQRDMRPRAAWLENELDHCRQCT
jgi:hypothetical protein